TREATPEKQSFDLAATLVGSGGMRHSAGSSARAVVLGVCQANEQLAMLGLPVARQLRLVELYADRAAEAWHTLRIEQKIARAPFALQTHVLASKGARERPVESAYRGSDYDLITATLGQDAERNPMIA